MLRAISRGRAGTGSLNGSEAARWLAAALAGLDVIPGRVLGRTAVDLLPDVVQVVTLTQGRNNRHSLVPASRNRGADHDRQVVHGCEDEDHNSRVTKRRIKISNEKRTKPDIMGICPVVLCQRS